MSSTRFSPSLSLLRTTFRPYRRPANRKPHILRLSSTSSTTHKPRRIRPLYVWYGLVSGLGVLTGHAIRLFGSPLPLPVPGSREDQLYLETLASDADKLDVVKSMRAQVHNLHTETRLQELVERRGGWIELDHSGCIAQVAEDRDRNTRTITQQAMAGSRGLGVQRAFWNSETKEIVAVVWMGGALSGWPGLAHGGAIATIFEDAMSRMVAGPNMSIDTISRPDTISVTYARPTLILNFYVLRASFSKPNLYQTAPPPDPESAKPWLEAPKDFTKKESAAPIWTPTVEISASLESLEGEVCVRAKGIFPARVA
ncbi:hypothetical protein BDV95DRAFT_376371 [Massariosphaeria phaeospora]|uniref:Thioesterase domain-containing protein n=1 Tax=Massariosphaeria phaeospora TaxID=100035 RepID=A0A7C8MAF7_9PLEO|nr:hypothetical protein BDV95DRAFT_376371 [Massariosphaeria phaeospora]